MHRDSNNLIVQADFDGGDCLSVTSAFYFIKPSPEFAENLKYLERTPGIYIRHPSYPDINDVSRDQLDPLICALGENGLRDKLKMLLSYHAEKFFFYPNNDLPMFSTPGLYIRALGLWYLYPILLILDLGFLFIFFQNLANHNPNDVDDRNCVVRFTQAIKHYPTPWSFLGRKLYAKTRPKNFGNTLGLGEKNNVYAALAWYHRPESGGNVEIAEAYRPTIERYFT